MQIINQTAGDEKWFGRTEEKLKMIIKLFQNKNYKKENILCWERVNNVEKKHEKITQSPGDEGK